MVSGAFAAPKISEVKENREKALEQSKAATTAEQNKEAEQKLYESIVGKENATPEKLEKMRSVLPDGQMKAALESYVEAGKSKDSAAINVSAQVRYVMKKYLSREVTDISLLKAFFGAAQVALDPANKGGSEIVTKVASQIRDFSIYKKNGMSDEDASLLAFISKVSPIENATQTFGSIDAVKKAVGEDALNKKRAEHDEWKKDCAKGKG